MMTITMRVGGITYQTNQVHFVDGNLVFTPIPTKENKWVPFKDVYKVEGSAQILKETGYSGPFRGLSE